MEPRFIKISGHAINLKGREFGRWTVLGPIGRNSYRAIIWLCRCSCGNEGSVASTILLAGESKSCGCYSAEVRSQVSRTHGLSSTPAYKNYHHMINRCYKESDSAFGSYGGRGIAVCEEWRNSRQAFCEHVAKLPHYGEPGRTIDRIDNDGDYKPGNVRWATKTEQGRNTRRNRHLTHDGKTQSVVEWAEELGISYVALASRLQSGWNTERALTTPVKSRGKYKRKADLAAAYGLDDTPQAAQTPAVALLCTKAALSANTPAFAALRARVWQLLRGRGVGG